MKGYILRNRFSEVKVIVSPGFSEKISYNSESSGKM